MPVMQDSVSVAANSVSSNVVAGQLYEFVPTGTKVTLSCTGSATGLRATLIANIPVMNDQARWGYFKFCRKIGEFADASCAAYFDPSNKTANIVVGALDGAPRSLSRLANIIAKDGWSSIHREIIAEHVSNDLPELDELDQKLFVTVISRCLDRAFKVEVQA